MAFIVLIQSWFLSIHQRKPNKQKITQCHFLQWSLKRDNFKSQFFLSLFSRLYIDFIKLDHFRQKKLFPHVANNLA